MSQYPYDQPPQQPYPAPPQPVYYAPPQPVQVNVTQNNGPMFPARKRINHGLHIALTFFTGGLWLFVYIPMVRRNNRPVAVTYYR